MARIAFLALYLNYPQKLTNVIPEPINLLKLIFCATRNSRNKSYVVTLFCRRSPYTPEKYSTPTRKSLPNRTGATAGQDAQNIRHSHIGHYHIAGDISDSESELTSSCKCCYFKGRLFFGVWIDMYITA